jgi:hypothetical protein
MTYLAAVLDTLLPGDEGSPAPLPSGSRAGIPIVDLPSEGLRAIAAEAGGEGAFEAASPAARIEVVRRTESRAPAAFQTLLAAVLTRYYQSDAVMTAMGWRLDPPQPAGHTVAATDPATWERLEKVKQRGRIWR